MEAISSHSSSSDGWAINDSESDYDEERSYRSREPAPKRLKTDKEDEETLDRLSALPDSVLLHILSLLPMKDVVKTSALSKKWQYLWTSVHNLIFVSEDCLTPDRMKWQFFAFVDKTLILCSCTKIKKFVVHFDYYGSDADVDSWIRFASEKNVEDLDLNFYGSSDVYRLPQHLFSNSSLRKLKLSLCDFEPSGVISWGSLKSLSLDNVDLSEDVIEKILSGCPLLEDLELSTFSGFSRLNVTSPNLRTLKLIGHLDFDFDDDAWLEIWAPNLRSLEISGCFYLKCRLVNVSSLVAANLSFWHSDPVFSTDDDEHEEFGNLLLELLESLRHVKELTIGTWCTQVLLILEVKRLPSTLLQCKCLTLDTHIENEDLPGIARLLQSSPYLETLVIDISSNDTKRFPFSREYRNGYIFNGEDYLTSQKRIFECLSQQLKNVIIVDFGKMHSNFELKLVQFLLEKARVLEKMVINSRRKRSDKCSECCMSQELFKVAQQLLSFPRSSPNAKVVFT
uniref:F-box domain-containing protein n=1 Tax=Davidia involucrata TaxID=16924 RepID=A0A5B7A369_DAVIN